jgi:CDP-paratose synthetase
MRILLTGGTGFLGAHVCQQLLKHGHTVTVCVREGSSHERLERLTDGMLPKPAFIRYEDLNFGSDYEAVIHMATTYGRGSKASSEIIQSNVLMPAQLLEQCLENDVKLFINTDSYYTAAGLEHPLAGYILSKRHFNEWARNIAGTRLKLVNMRIEHLYGPMDASDKFCTFIVRECLLDKQNIALTECDQLRDFIYVEDAASAYVALLDHVGDCAFGWNEIGVGNGYAIQLREFVTRAHSLARSRSDLRFGDISKPRGEIAASKADNSFLIARGWRCATSLEDGIRYLIEDQRKEICAEMEVGQC